MKDPQILFQNDDFLVINKPAGYLSIPARAPLATDLVVTEWISSQLKLRPWVIHRLDRYTTGVMIIALTPESHQTGNQWFEKKEAKKVYHFLAAPPPNRPAIQIKTPVDGKSAQTLFEVIQKTSDWFYGKAIPMTGRFHQIREHAQMAGFPLLGDKTFGSKIKFPRVALHAFELTTPLGYFTAPLPLDFTVKIQELSGTASHA